MNLSRLNPGILFSHIIQNMHVFVKQNFAKRALISKLKKQQRLLFN